jgi:tetratricopeptide (TPR) repeat protein
MRRHHPPLLGVLFLSGLPALLALSAARPAAAADLFYQGLLRDGTHAYDRKDYAAAARDLRLACFGMLDEPKPLADCLVRLALAQDRAGDSAGFGETFNRIAEIEERFGAYSQAQVAPELRAAFEQRLAVVIPAATLDDLAVFRGLAAKKPPATASGPDRKAATSKEPAKEIAKEPERRPETVQAPAPETPAMASAAPPVPSPATLTDADRQKMATARSILEGEGKTRDLKRALQLAREVADPYPQSVEAQHLAAEAAYRLSRWQDAATYFRRGGEPQPDQPELTFYMAVALFESGDRAAAANALKRCLPSLQKTPYVESYARKILG